MSIINNKEYNIKKLSTENKELYGSVKPTEISKIIFETDKLEIKPSMIQLIKEIKSLGKFNVKVTLHSEVEATININSVSRRNNPIIIQFFPQYFLMIFFLS